MKPIPRPDKSREVKVGNEVKIYTLTPEELEKYRNLKPETDRDGKRITKAVATRIDHKY